MHKRIIGIVLAIVVVFSLSFACVAVARHDCGDKNSDAPGHGDTQPGERNGHEPRESDNDDMSPADIANSTRDNEPNQFYLNATGDLMADGSILKWRYPNWFERMFGTIMCYDILLQTEETAGAIPASKCFTESGDWGYFVDPDDLR